ncbi:MAG: sigma-54 dependent transcriptional regulator [Gammaproteobacteria bacterium]|nr:sigma-54 dependent transcriptional regulator [Gammaproteobacteria bacterium]MDH5630909.1 sigma-54 dependent transcriptional regulator [Gammaproteobacteria bacterium]
MSSNVLIVEDDQALREALTSSLKVNGYQTHSVESAESALGWISQGETPDIIVTDIQMGKMSGIELLKSVRQKYTQLPVVLMTAYGEISDAVEAMRLGACDYLQKPFEASRLTDLIENYVQRNHADEIVIADPKSKALFDYALRIAQTDSNVLLSGPSGAGKEVMARFIHDNSPRSKQSFVAINCAAIPENMLEATLFGYEKGAFTGAYQSTPGKFERAQGGTLLLDEISEMDLSLQAKLLRVIQEKELERLGGKQTIDLDVRIIATTNRNLKQEVAEKNFREDLYYRLNVFPLQCLALRERPQDIIPLAETLLDKYRNPQRHNGTHFSKAAKAKLTGYKWPGNVRELDNLVQRVAVLANQPEIEAADIQFEGFHEQCHEDLDADQENTNLSGSVLGNDMQHHEFKLIVEALDKHRGKKKDVAEALGISPRTLRYKLAKMREFGYSI